MRGEAGEALGLVFAARPDAGHVLFRWTSREERSEGEAEPGLTGLRQIVSVEPPAPAVRAHDEPGGPAPGSEEGAPPVEKVLAAAPGGYIPGQWYRVEVELGLRPGDRIVTAGTHKVVEGKPLRAKAPSSTGQARRPPPDDSRDGEGT